MSKGSRQRTYGAKFNENWDKIFGKRGSNHEAPLTGSQKPSETVQNPHPCQPKGSK